MTRRTTRLVRGLLLASSALVAVAGFQLFALGEHTDTCFAFTIDEPITAAWLGANYGAAWVLELLASRERDWANARAAVPGVLVFTVVTSVVTLANLEYLHATSPLAWIWVAVYVAAPVAFAVALFGQVRAPGVDPPRAAPLPPWLRAGFAVEGAALVVLGATFVASDDAADALSPWSLANGDDSLAPYVGAWLLGLGVVAAQAAWENDRARVRAVCWSQLAAGALHAMVLARYGPALHGRVSVTSAYGAAVAWLLLFGAAGTAATRRRTRRRPRGTWAPAPR